ncbi:polyprenyl synthetase family protein [Scrofimicrobium sp. R131]|uniref:Polyprenyl synthetase family protein n=1 Tax=Scrofimicrobium appendicitidis TaxID=3079930 RepID=A0AAU7VA88_9ACTO
MEHVENLLVQSTSSRRGFVSELIGHLSSAGGKRLRPVLTLVSAQLGQDEPRDEVIKAAVVVEMTHLASLYHDDVMDSAPTRRGVDSAQHLWGNNRAILAGDVLFARASLLTAELGPETVSYHARIFERMCEGQLNESFGPTAQDDPVEFYLQVLADKTGALVAAAAYLGAMHGGASEEHARIVEEFGERIGVAFQIADDVLDLTSPRELSGKTPGTDLREGVDTLPVLLLRRREDADSQRILALLDTDLSSDRALAEVVDAICAHPVLEETRQMARDWAKAAEDALAPLPDSEAKTALLAFAAQMVDRKV